MGYVGGGLGKNIQGLGHGVRAPFLHVGVAEGRPRVSHAVRSRAHRDASLAEAAHRRRRPVARRGGHDRDAVFVEEIDQAGGLALVDHAETERVADGHPATQPEGAGALGDHADLLGALLARVVQVDVHAGAVAARDAEDRVQLAAGVAVDAGGVHAADQLGSVLHRSLEQIGGARTRHHTALREGHHLDRDEVAQPPPRRHHAVEVAQADLGVDVDVAADVQRPAADRLPHQPLGLDVDRQPQLAPEPPLREDMYLPEMAERAAVLVHGVLLALVETDAVKAREIAVEDDEIDRLYHATFEEVVELMRQDPTNVERGTRIIIASHYLERIGDRATNIAEDVVYLVTGDVDDLNP